jgi:hypothetical protein
MKQGKERCIEYEESDSALSVLYCCRLHRMRVSLCPSIL